MDAKAQFSPDSRGIVRSLPPRSARAGELACLDASNAELQLLSGRQVSSRFHVSEACLRRWRAIGQGPPWLRIGKRLVRYDVGALRRWLEEAAGVRGAQ
jgi:predicted DNA-binding transcriptional regulator AlpA